MALELKSQRKAMRQLINQQIAVHTATAIAHEINQPLTSASVYAETALRMWHSGNPRPDKLEHALKATVEQAQRAGRTRHELLTFLQQGKITVEPVDLHSAVRDALATAEENGCNAFAITLQVAPDLGPVLSNPLQLQKVLVNLLFNCVEAMSEPMSAKHEIAITIQPTVLKKMAQTTIKDNGPGPSPELIRKIFDPFFTTKEAGIGLGLTISRSLIEAQGGQLWVDEQADSGAVFHFTLPFAT